MSKLRQPILFSEHFGVDPQYLAQQGTLDPVLNMDTRLFVDPMLLPASSRGEMRRASRRYLGWFGRLGDLLAHSKRPGDTYWNQARDLLLFPEPPATCLGHTVEGVKGKGVGVQLADQLLCRAMGLVGTGKDTGKAMSCLPFLHKGFGPDRISDMVTQIILPDLADYTESVLDRLSLKRTSIRRESRNYEVPDYGGHPVLLVPLDVLGELEVAVDIGKIDISIQRNHELRRRVSDRLGGMIRVGAHGWLSQLIRLMDNKNPEAIEVFYDLLTAASAPYDAESDPKGYLIWRKGLDVSKKHHLEIQSRAPIDQVGAIVEQFDIILHMPTVSRCLYRDENAAEVRPVSALRLLFFAVANSYCSHKAELAVEYDTSTELTTFIWQNNPIVHIDIASSKQSNIISRYKKGPHEKRWFVLIDFADGDKANAVFELKNARRARGEIASEVRIIEV